MEVHISMRLSVKFTPHGCAWILADRTLPMIRGMSERQGSIMGWAQRRRHREIFWKTVRLDFVHGMSSEDRNTAYDAIVEIFCMINASCVCALLVYISKVSRAPLKSKDGINIYTLKIHSCKACYS